MSAAYSVLMSVYEKENPVFLEVALQSMLDQTIRPDQFVLVCDGPLTPSLNEVVESYCSRFPSFFDVVRLEENRGLGEALSFGLPFCRNPYVARMDSDDIALPDRVACQLEMFKQNEDLAVVGGQIAEFESDPEILTGYRNVPVASSSVHEYAKSRNPLNHMTVVFKKDCVLAAGGYLDFAGFEDYYLWARMLAAGYKIANVPRVCVLARAGREMYRRRGGKPYFDQAFAFQKELYRLGLIGRLRFLANVFARFATAVLMPNVVRGLFYKMILRQKSKGSESRGEG